jgi:hypothetical protein
MFLGHARVDSPMSGGTGREHARHATGKKHRNKSRKTSGTYLAR